MGLYYTGFLKGRIDMTNNSVPVKSITYAMKGQRILQQYGITAYVSRDHTIKSGCGYRLSFHGDYEQVITLLRRNGIALYPER